MTDNSIPYRIPKLEVFLDSWWIESAILERPTVCGNVSGWPNEEKTGFHISGTLLRADFVKGVVETDEAFYKLGKPMQLSELKIFKEQKDE